MDRTIANTRNFKTAGFSLIEIMVGLVIGLLATLVIMQTFSGFEGQKRTTTSGSDAQTNGALALYSVERDVRMAGYGFGVAAALGCKINTSFNGTPGLLSLVPITITNGANSTPDSIQILSSSSNSFSVPSSITVDHPAQATNFFINSTAGMKVGDLLVAFEAGKDCTLLQITGIPNGNVQIHHQNTSPWDPPGGQNIFPASGYNKGATLFNLGGLINRAYSISAAQAGGLQLTTFNSANNTSSTVTIVPNIINMQILYGKDTNGDGDVDTYDDTSPTTNAGWQQVQAAKMVLAARSTQWEKDPVTTGDGTLPWSGSTLAALRIDKNPDGTANADWQHYRYKIFEAVIPLRNVIWRQ